MINLLKKSVSLIQTNHLPLILLIWLLNMKNQKIHTKIENNSNYYRNNFIHNILTLFLCFFINSFVCINTSRCISTTTWYFTIINSFWCFLFYWLGSIVLSTIIISSALLCLPWTYQFIRTQHFHSDSLGKLFSTWVLINLDQKRCHLSFATRGFILKIK